MALVLSGTSGSMTVDASAGITFNSGGTQANAAYPVAGTTMYEYAQTLNSNYTVTSGRNAQTVGPFTIGTGYTLTIPTSSRFVVV